MGHHIYAIVYLTIECYHFSNYFKLVITTLFMDYTTTILYIRNQKKSNFMEKYINMHSNTYPQKWTFVHLRVKQLLPINASLMYF
jgi:hypothetical protein